MLLPKLKKRFLNITADLSKEFLLLGGGLHARHTAQYGLKEVKKYLYNYAGLV